eukprot:12248939-Alexandrium_andersonii.AAC.1
MARCDTGFVATRDAWKFLRAVPVGIELRVRCLRWMQQVASEQRHRAQLVAAICGKFDCEVTPGEGHFMEVGDHTPPCVRQFSDDARAGRSRGRRGH